MDTRDQRLNKWTTIEIRLFRSTSILRLAPLKRWLPYFATQRCDATTSEAWALLGVYTARLRSVTLAGMCPYLVPNEVLNAPTFMRGRTRSRRSV